MAQRIEKLNRTQKLLTAEQARVIPALYAQEGQHYDATVYVKFFYGTFTWYATEYDPREQMFYGVVFNEGMRDQLPLGEPGYFTAEELATFRGQWGLQVERDIHFKPQTLRVALKQEHGVEVPADDGADEDVTPAMTADWNDFGH
jgi:hypothetical protein